MAAICSACLAAFSAFRAALSWAGVGWCSRGGGGPASSCRGHTRGQRQRGGEEGGHRAQQKTAAKAQRVDLRDATHHASECGDAFQLGRLFPAAGWLDGRQEGNFLARPEEGLHVCGETERGGGERRGGEIGEGKEHEAGTGATGGSRTQKEKTRGRAGAACLRTRRQTSRHH